MVADASYSEFLFESSNFIIGHDKISTVQSLSCVWLFVTPWPAAHQASLSFTISWSLPKFMSVESVMPSNHFILCHSLLLLPSVFPSIKVFSNESALCIRWPKYWSFTSASVLSVSIQGWFPLRLTGLISLQSKDSQESSPTSQFKSINSSAFLLWSSSHVHTWLPERL